ncbi:MAG: helix-turn-helix transcriptional regulator [Candidatus Heimdallarchaeota archaeon]|nr:helix-turn-helix transcriptional regulator [Candidatus Heimdallarchaeota archaeon]
MQVQDVITYSQMVTKNITDKEIAKYFFDNDYGILLKFLRTGPKTIKEIEEYYKLEGNEKSDKTIYRYINTLTEAGLVVEAGKRIYTDEEFKNKSLTIYMRTAKVFNDLTKEMRADMTKEKKFKRGYEAFRILLDMSDEKKTFSEECIAKIIEKVYIEGLDLASSLMEKVDEKIFSLLEGYDFSDVNDFILNTAWLLMIHNNDFKKILNEC